MHQTIARMTPVGIVVHSFSSVRPFFCQVEAVEVREARVIGTTAYVATGPRTGFFLGSISTIGGCPDLIRSLQAETEPQAETEKVLAAPADK